MIDSELSLDNRVDFTAGSGLGLFREFVAQQTALPTSDRFILTGAVFSGSIRETMQVEYVDDQPVASLGDLVIVVTDVVLGEFNVTFPALPVGTYWYSLLYQSTAGSPAEIWCWGQYIVEDQPTIPVEEVPA